MITWFFAIAVIGYGLGTLPTGYLVGRAYGIDIRQWGSGATGGTNVTRTLGFGAGLLTGLIDVLKGTAAAYFGLRLAGDWGYAVGAVAAALGHSYPVWLRFRGGKMVATFAGAFVILYPVSTLLGFLAFLGAAVPTRYVSLGSIVGTAVCCGLILFGGSPPAHRWLVLAAFLLIVYRHRDNVRRLLSGTENKFGQKAKPRTGTEG